MRWMICKLRFGINETLEGAMLTEERIDEFWPTMVDRYSIKIELRSALVRSGNQKKVRGSAVVAAILQQAHVCHSSPFIDQDTESCVEKIFFVWQ